MGDKLGKRVLIGEHVRVGKYKLLELEDSVSIMGNVILGYAVGGRISLKKGVLVEHDVVFCK